MVANLEPLSEPQPCVLTIPFGYFIPVVWCFCFVCLYKSQRDTFSTLPLYRRGGGGDEPLVAVPVRPTT